jgi:hypothetical protein
MVSSKSKLLTTGAAIGLGLLALGTRPAQADPFNVNLTMSSPTDLGSGTYRYDYELVLAGTEQFTLGDYFTIYDFAGFTGTTGTPAGFTASSNLIGQTPATQIVADNPTIPNITFTKVSGGSLGAGTYGGFFGVSTLDLPVAGTFSIAGTDNGRFVGAFEGNGITGVPSVPEPGMVAFAATSGMGLLGMMGRVRLRSKRSAQSAA